MRQLLICWRRKLCMVKSFLFKTVIWDASPPIFTKHCVFLRSTFGKFNFVEFDNNLSRSKWTENDNLKSCIMLMFQKYSSKNCNLYQNAINLQLTIKQKIAHSAQIWHLRVRWPIEFDFLQQSFWVLHSSFTFTWKRSLFLHVFKTKSARATETDTWKAHSQILSFWSTRK